MLLRNKMNVVVGSVALSAMALAGCSTGAQPPAQAPVPVVGQQQGGSGDQPAEAGSSGETASSGTEIRSGVHGGEQRVVFDFGNVGEISSLSKFSDALDAQAPSRGGSGEPVDGMQGKNYIHVVVKADGLGSATTDAVKLQLPKAKSAVVNDHEGGTAEMAIGIDADYIDYEVKVEGKKVIVSMYCAADQGCA